jgi:2-dehydropantoate 2-reductase
VNADNSTWHVLGAGSIGCLFTAYLRQASRNVQLIVRDAARLAQLQSAGGITLEQAGTQTLIEVAACSPRSITQPIAQLLICTKAQHTLAALRSIKKYLTEKPLLVLLQNGMGVRESILAVIPDAIVLNAITTHGAFQHIRFHVVHAGLGETVVGAINPHEQHYADYVAQALQCELPMAVVTDIAQRMWLKLAINSVINPLSAMYQCRNGELRNIPHIETTIEQLCTEFNAVASADNQVFATTTLIENVMRVINDTAENRSSMLQDILARRPTEIDAINGFILKRAMQHRILCPQHVVLFDAIKLKEHAFS